MNNKEQNTKKNDTPKHAIRDLKEGEYYSGTVKITKKIRPGPTILVVTDGTGFTEAVTMNTVSFDVGDVIDITGKVSERLGKLRVELNTLKKSDANFDDILEEITTPKQTTFSIKSDKYETLRPYFEKIAHRMRRAIVNNQPIFIRHHADTDGITSGMVIEKACANFMEEIGLNPDYGIYRSPSKAPFYEITDMFRDLTLAEKISKEKTDMKPLIFVVDNGSTPEDVISHKSLKALGYDIIVVDHHNPVVLENKKTAVCPYVEHHLNPYMEGFDSKLTAGMLSYELARFIDTSFDAPNFPAVSAYGDRSDIEEAETYKENATASRDLLEKIAVTMDFMAYHLRFDSGKGVYEKLFENSEFVEILYEQVTQGFENQLQSTLPYLRSREVNGIYFSYIDLAKYTVRFSYPTPGKLIGSIHDEVAQGKEHLAVLTIGYLGDMVIIRATQPILPVPTLVEELQNEFPQANVDGGGHECAGTIKFNDAFFDEIFERIKEKVFSQNYFDSKEDEE